MAAGPGSPLAQVALDVLGEAARRVVAAVAVLLQGLHHDPVEVARQELRQPLDVRCRGCPPGPWPSPPSDDSRVLGRGASSSRISRCISA